MPPPSAASRAVRAQASPPGAGAHRYAALGHGGAHSGHGQDLLQPGQALPVRPALGVGVGLVGQGGGAGPLGGAGDHETGVLADLTQEPHHAGVAGVPAEAQAGQVAALGKGMHGQHPVQAAVPAAVAEHGAGRAVPGELGITLVAGHQGAACPPQAAAAARSSRAPAGLAGLLTHSTRARAPSTSSTASRRRRKRSSTGTATGLRPARRAPIS